MAAQDLCSLSDVRAFLELPASDTARDSLISATITPISDAIARYCEREFVPTASATRTFRLDVASRKLDLAPYDLRTASSVQIHSESAAPITLSAVRDYQLHPITSRFGTYNYVQFAGNLANLYQSDSGRFFGYIQVSIAGAWGFASVPSDVKQAAIISVASAIRRDVPTLDVGDFLNTDPRQMTPDRPVNYAIPAAALRLLGPFRRPGMR